MMVRCAHCGETDGCIDYYCAACERCVHEHCAHTRMMIEPVLLRDFDFAEYPLRSIRRALGWTLGDMARATALPVVAISEIERKKRRPDRVEAASISLAVATRLETALGEEG